MSFTPTNEALRALVRVVHDRAEADLGSAVFASPPGELLALLERHRLAPLYFEQVRERPTLRDKLPPGLEEQLARRRHDEAARAMVQEQAALRLSGSLRQAGIEHVFYKAMYLRRVVYEPPSLRPADDIDVLVREVDRTRAFSTLYAAGFTPVRRDKLLTHEQSVLWRGVDIDLHWRFFRPGRARFDPSDEVLAAALDARGLPIPSNEHALALLLLNTALGDHVTGRLIRALDIDRVIRQTRPDWNEVVTLIRRLGLRTAGWATLTWVRAWLQTPVPGEVWASLEPGRLRGRYLSAWLARDPYQIYHRHKNLTRVAFSLALQDSLSDSLRSATTYARLLTRSERARDSETGG